jgi:hypothetical protein
MHGRSGASRTCQLATTETLTILCQPRRSEIGWARSPGNLRIASDCARGLHPSQEEALSATPSAGGRRSIRPAHGV